MRETVSGDIARSEHGYTVKKLFGNGSQSGNLQTLLLQAATEQLAHGLANLDTRTDELLRRQDDAARSAAETEQRVTDLRQELGQVRADLYAARSFSEELADLSSLGPQIAALRTRRGNIRDARHLSFGLMSSLATD
jgi:chromosome segregation ATPase